jgi:hypothetical protein
VERPDIMLKALGFTFVFCIILEILAAASGFDPAKWIARAAVFISLYQALKKDSK